jgi:hypothetical protein
MHQHERIMMPHARGNLKLDEQLLAEDDAAGAAGESRALDTRPEEAPLRDIECRTAARGSHSFGARHEASETCRYGQTGGYEIAAAEIAHGVDSIRKYISNFLMDP